MPPGLGRMPAGARAIEPAANSGKIPSPALRGGRVTGQLGGGTTVAVRFRSASQIHSDVPGDSTIFYSC